jgi:phospholipid/cholesterol/gamma-HCH transport system ATP-binding protein
MAHGTPQSLDVEEDARVRQFVHGEADGPVPFHYPAVDYLADMLDVEVRR